MHPTIIAAAQHITDVSQYEAIFIKDYAGLGPHIKVTHTSDVSSQFDYEKHYQVGVLTITHHDIISVEGVQ